ncbi:hypothetical protein ACERK3_08010 [Phycisphaerales bacterium AB-hyl4]|uniref:Uncharacterized protein n=1 Tax=Natronomicrosphaera hydrolytica TaxID=3242702 RepID=A0ABV4U6W2_9BACT
MLLERGALDAIEDSASLRDRRRGEQLGNALEMMMEVGGIERHPDGYLVAKRGWATGREAHVRW